MTTAAAGSHGRQQTVADDRTKSRVTFYYLTAKELGTLGALA